MISELSKMILNSVPFSIKSDVKYKGYRAGSDNSYIKTPSTHTHTNSNKKRTHHKRGNLSTSDHRMKMHSVWHKRNTQYTCAENDLGTRTRQSQTSCKLKCAPKINTHITHQYNKKQDTEKHYMCMSHTITKVDSWAPRKYHAYTHSAHLNKQRLVLV